MASQRSAADEAGNFARAPPHRRGCGLAACIRVYTYRASASATPAGDLFSDFLYIYVIKTHTRPACLWRIVRRVRAFDYWCVDTYWFITCVCVCARERELRVGRVYYPAVQCAFSDSHLTLPLFQGRCIIKVSLCESSMIRREEF